MRLTINLIAGLLVSGGLCLVASDVEALSCGPPTWDTGGWYYGSYGDASEWPTVPADAVLWMTESCPFSEGPPEPGVCKLVRVGEAGQVEEELAMTVEDVGDEACELPREELVGDSREHDSFLRLFVPEEPLVVGEDYRVECDGRHVVAVRVHAGAAAPVQELPAAKLHYTRGDDGCCAIGDYVEMRLESGEAKYLDDGGYIELVYSTGQVFAATRPQNDEAYMLPPTHDSIVMTPVRADGTRGESVETGDISGDLVYLPCKVVTRPSPLGLWLLAPLVWMGAHARRRRGGRSA